MVQEGAAAVAASQSAAAKKKKNKNKNKKKTGGQAGQGSGQPQLAKSPSEERSRSGSEAASSVAAPVKAPEPAPVAQEPFSSTPKSVPAPEAPVQPAAAALASGGLRNETDLLTNLAKEVSDHLAKFGNWAEIKDAEKLYYQHLAKKKAEPAAAAAPVAAKDEDSDDVDFFASDEDDKPKAKPQLVKVQPKGPPASVASKQKEQAPKKKAKVESKAAPASAADESCTFKSSLAAEIAKARQHIKNSLECVDGIADMAGGAELVNKINSLELENKNLKKVTEDLRNLVLTLEKRVASLEGKGGAPAAAAPAPKAEPAKPAADDDDDDVDLFGSDDEEEDAEAARVREERLKAYAEKKSKKPALIAKTSVLLDVKPWDDETDMNKMLECVKTIEKDGLVWGASKLVPVGYGINKLQVMCVVEDEKVSIDELCEQIQEFEDYVQSVDIAAMSKI